MKAFVVHCATVAVLVGSVPNIVWAGSTGRRNTAIAATAIAVGAWSNGTGRAGRRNTAILTTAGAAVAWGRYNDKRKEENRRSTRRVVVQGRPVVRREVIVERRPEVVHREVIVERRPEVVHREVIVERRPEVCREVVYVPVKEKHGKKWGHYKHCGRWHDDDDD